MLTLHRSALVIACLAAGSACVAVSQERPAAGTGFSPGLAGCALVSSGRSNPYSVAMFRVLPGRRITLRLDGEHREPHTLHVSGGALEGGGREWIWTAPEESGIYEGALYHPDDDSVTQLKMVVLVPLREARSGTLNGYEIGSYPSPMAGREAFYATPRGFIEITPENQDMLVSPHFRLRQFLSKQEQGFPKYVVLTERLLIALESILDGVNRRGFSADTLFVMSGYRTPVYNRALGNVVNSRHIFGDAADIFVDQSPRDGIMDDLDGNGQSDPGDNRILAGIVEESLVRAGPAFAGGMGEYPATSAHGPFVHVDLRGYRARW